MQNIISTKVISLIDKYLSASSDIHVEFYLRRITFAKLIHAVLYISTHTYTCTHIFLCVSVIKSSSEAQFRSIPTEWYERKLEMFSHGRNTSEFNIFRILLDCHANRENASRIKCSVWKIDRKIEREDSEREQIK